ncbi:uncharacterized protein FIBRA_04324 [Fibroporia radiculosa]|uniref:FAD-binding domain-containing protein n=1 Tax=Fibroporia radiculosa TaxID=599839 RepID=J4G770_9APHY|nr:uncharacterized protein FIBRA_04324 [Fibroporia radiculosa]CCM02243.1 predicted protein [Fibroporia radiculosa]
MRHYLRFIDLEAKFDEQGFVHKPGAAFKLVQSQPENYADFYHLGPSRTTWNVLREDMDKLMLDHAVEQGVKVFEETRVESLIFEGGTDSGRPISAFWKNKQGGSGSIKFEWLVDASGRQGLMSTKYLKNRLIREGLKNVAVYGYWKGVTRYKESRRGEVAPCTDRSGWAWVIPLPQGITSIGIVMHQETSNKKKAQCKGGLVDHYMEQLKLCPGVQTFIGEKGEFIEGSTRSTSDYSYHATAYSGDHFRIIGDAAAFIDPLFSSGVHIALTGALSAACTILGVRKGQVTEVEAQAWHDAKIGICQTRFLMVVLSAYRQMHHEGVRAVVTDIDDKTFEQAFEFFRPVYIGETDTEAKLSERTMETLIEFTRSLFIPTTHEQEQYVFETVSPELLSVSGPLIGSEELEKVLDTDHGDAKAVLKKLNALKIERADTSPDSFTWDAVNGYVVQLERGKLGLVKA